MDDEVSNITTGQDEASASQNREMPPASKKLAFPQGWDISLEDYLPSHIIDLLVEQAQYHYDRLVRLGYVRVLGDAKFTVDCNLMWVPQGMKRMAPEELEKRPRKMICGPDVPRSPSQIPPEREFGEDVPMLEPGTKLVPDYAEYEDMVKTWSAVPDGAHWAWKAGLEEVKALEEGDRSEATLRKLVTKASVAEMDDWRMVHQKVKQVFERDVVLSFHEMDTVLPLAFGRILGIRPPESPIANIWSNCLMSRAMEVNMAAASRIVLILHSFQQGRAHEQFAKAVVEELGGLVKVSTEWLGKWVGFIEEDISSAD